MKRFRILILFLLVCLVLISGCIEEKATPELETQKYGSISGKVIPADSGAKVQAIQNLAVVGEAMINPLDGGYTIQDLPKGKYGLLFTSDGTNVTHYSKVYIYNDEINIRWFGEGGRITVNETIIVVAGQDSFNYDINLSAEYPDYFADRVFVRFKPNVSKDEIKNTVQFYNSSIVEMPNLKGVGSSLHEIDIPDDKTVLEITNVFKSTPSVEFVQPDIVASFAE